MVSGTEGADLLKTTFQCAVAEQFRIGALKSAALLRVFKILLAAVTLRYRPARPILKQTLLITLGKLGNRPLGAHSGRNERKERLDNFRKFFFDLAEDQTGLD
jgi:hypothetical protein